MSARTKTAAPRHVQEKRGPSPWKRFSRRLTFLIFLAALIFLFIRGWIQLDIPEGQAALIYTKSGRYDDRLVENGGLVWRWEAIIPTFLNIHLIPLRAHDARVTLEGDLPSGQIYLDHAETKGDFSYRMELFLSYRLRPDYIAGLIRDNQVDPDKLDDLYERTDSRILGWCAAHALEMHNSDQSSPAGKAVDMPALEREFPEAEFFAVQPDYLRLPDFALYLELREHYFLYLEQRNQALSEAAVQIAGLEQDTQYRLGVLEEYGKLITQYPLLLDFFRIDGENLIRRYTGSELLPSP